MPGIAVIGIGNWGKNHARVYKELCAEGVADTVLICDADQARVLELSSALGIQGTSECRQVLNDPRIQAISIATPSRTHYEIARECMEAGKDVLVEKPMTMDVAQAEELVGIADKNNRILMVGHIFRYHPAVQELKRRIDAGELGKIQTIISNRETFGLPRKDMGVIYALGTHELDMFCYLIGVDYPKTVTAVTSKVYSQDIEETAMLAVDFGDVKGYAFESWQVPGHGKRRDLLVVGTKMSARVDYLKPQELCLFDTRIITENGAPTSIEDKGERVISLPYVEPLKQELRQFISCVNSRQRPLADGLVGLRAVAMAEAALASAKMGRAVSLPPGSKRAKAT
jgi:UDP-N-acetylglucosamine 3-dehydrogenase